jgi:hypothetical protein
VIRSTTSLAPVIVARAPAAIEHPPSGPTPVAGAPAAVIDHQPTGPTAVAPAAMLLEHVAASRAGNPPTGPTQVVLQPIVVEHPTGQTPVVWQPRRARGTPTPPPFDAVAPPPAETTETRAPHSLFILPANPLSELTDESLRGFIDCRLYEDTAFGSEETMTRRPPVEETVTRPPPIDEPLPLPPPPAPPAAFPAPSFGSPAILPPFASQPLNAPTFRPVPTMVIDVPSRGVRWDLVIATITLALAMVFAAATLARGARPSDAPPRRGAAPAAATAHPG